jgi:hypothetical protein
MEDYKILESDTWFYTGLPRKLYDDALVKGSIEPIDLGSGYKTSPGLVISKEEAFIDGHIEGYLTRVYGEGEFTKLWIMVPQGTTLYYDVIDEGVPLSHIITISIPIVNSTHVETWECGPELAEGVVHEFKMEEEFGPRLPSPEPHTGD